MDQANWLFGRFSPFSAFFRHFLAVFWPRVELVR